MPLRPAPASQQTPAPPPRYSRIEVEDPDADVSSRLDPEADSQMDDGEEETDVVTGLDGRPVRDETIFEASGPGMSTRASMRKDGRISVVINSHKKLPDLPPDYAVAVKEYGVDLNRPLRVPILNIVIFIVGSRGDVQPYLAAALTLIKDHGHRVRIATHDTFEKFVLDQKVHLEGRTARDGRDLRENLEFYGIGGDPQELMAYMVKNPGLIPGMSSLTNGDIGRKQAMIKEMIKKFYRSTFMPCPQNFAPFAAEAIISNPPAFAHIHTAEALGIPLTMSFTMPWTATTAFSHPLVAVEQSDTPSALTNYLTFALASALTWQGLGSTINRFRKKRLGLEAVSMASGASAINRLKVPYIYCWTSELIPKPRDWMQNIDITGFLFLESAGYQPTPDLARFLADGPPPVYIGFGSIVVEDPAALTRLLLDAIKFSGVRALLSAGWSKIGGSDVPPNVFLLGDCPHDWLFANGRVSAVVIHGGAGTTAIALKNGLPVVVVPFFGDQPFWGAMIAKRGAGPEPLPFKSLTSVKLAQAIQYAISPEAKRAAIEVGSAIRNEDGARKFADSFHAHLPLLHMRCDIDSDRVAVWWSEKYALRLSALAAEVLVRSGKIKDRALIPWRPSEYNIKMPATDPISGGAVAILNCVTEFGEGFFRVFSLRPDKGLMLMTTALRKALATTLMGLTEGLETLPSLYGTEERRPRTKVTGIGSGFAAAGKGFAFGMYDGVTGLVRDPMRGAQTEGALGFTKGLARASINLAVQPAAGMFGLFSHPVKGIGRSCATAFRTELAEKVLRKPRLEMGKQHADGIADEVKQEYVRQFDELAPRVKERRKMLKEEAKRWLRDLEQEAGRSRQAGEAMMGGSEAGL